MPLTDCRRCPRLVRLRESVRESHPDYHAAPVPAWGNTRSRLLIVGLAPGMHGANRTGRPFTGDASGSFLFEALCGSGFASTASAADAQLLNTRITNAVKCLPPGNRPVASEIAACRGYLEGEIDVLLGSRPRLPRCLLCLGRVAHDAVARALAGRARDPIDVPPFGHGQLVALRPNVWLADTYHPSRQNTNTGRLTAPMLNTVLARISRLLRSG